jgi:hypothetical protein
MLGMSSRFARALKLTSRSCSLHTVSTSLTRNVKTPGNLLHRCMSSKIPEEKKEVVGNDNEDFPNMIYYFLYSTAVYGAVYGSSIATLYMALSSGVITADYFDIDQVESAAKVTYPYSLDLNLIQRFAL